MWNKQTQVLPFLGVGAFVVPPITGGGVNVGWRFGAIPVITPGLGVSGLGMKPGVGVGPAVGLTGHCGTLQQDGSAGSATIIQALGIWSYLAHL